MASKITTPMIEAGVAALALGRRTLGDEAIVASIFSAMTQALRIDNARKAQEAPEPYHHQAWPSWRYSPAGGESKLCEDADDVPEGWLEAPPEAAKRGRPRKEAA